jgi:hypothetical protein
VEGGESALAQQLGDRGREDHFPLGRLGLERCVHALAGELPVDADHTGLVVDVGPGEPERLADPQAGVGEQLEQRSVGTGVVEQPGEVAAFEDRDLAGAAVGLLGGFEFGDGVVGQPAAADGVAADLVERDQGHAARGRRELALVRPRPVGDAIDGQVTQLERPERPACR